MAEEPTKQEKARPFFLNPSNMKLTKQTLIGWFQPNALLAIVDWLLLLFVIVHLLSSSPAHSHVRPETAPLGQSGSKHSSWVVSAPLPDKLHLI